MCQRASESYYSYVFFLLRHMRKGVCCCNFYLKVVCLSVFSWAKGFFVFHVLKAKLIACLRFLGCHERCVLFFCCNFYLKVVGLCFLRRKVFFVFYVVYAFSWVSWKVFVVWAKLGGGALSGQWAPEASQLSIYTGEFTHLYNLGFLKSRSIFSWVIQCLLPKKLCLVYWDTRPKIFES